MQAIRVAAAAGIVMAVSGCSVLRGYTMPDEDNLVLKIQRQWLQWSGRRQPKPGRSVYWQ